MKLAAIFQDLEHLYYFQTTGYGNHFVIQNEVKINFAQTCFYSHKHSLQSGEDIMQKSDEWHRDRRMHEWKAFYNLPTTAFGCWWEIIIYLKHCTLYGTLYIGKIRRTFSQECINTFLMLKSIAILN